MTPTITDFIKFLQHNVKDIESFLASQKKLNWKGEETDSHSTIAEKFNFFSPEFASYFATKIKNQVYQEPKNIPLLHGPLYQIAERIRPQLKPFLNFQLITKTFAHTRGAFNIKYAQDKDIFITAGDDGCICFWSAFNGEFLEKMCLHRSPINILKYYSTDQLIVTADTSGQIRVVSCSSSLSLKNAIDTGREIDKIHLFWAGDQMRLFCAIKNGPYIIYSIDDNIKELFRSGASYKESAILKGGDFAFFVVKTNSGLFSINFCRESQETWFLTEDDPLFILSNKCGNILFALCKQGKMLALGKPKNDVKPVIIFEHYANIDFSEINVIQIFDSTMIAIKIQENTSEIKIFSVFEDNMFDLIANFTLPRICYFVRENPCNSNVLAIATVDGALLFVDISNNGLILSEKRLSSAINDFLFSNDGRSLALLDDSGSVTFYSSGHMPCDESLLKILPDDYNPKMLANHVRLRNMIKPVLFTAKRKRELQPAEEKKRIKEAPKPAQDVEELEHLPYWSSVFVNQAQPYVPQIGDIVIYFYKPHLEFLRRNGRKLKEMVDYEDLIPKGKSHLEGTVESVEYIPADLVKCQIVLKAMIGRKNFRLTFTYFFGIPQPNYLVLKSAFDCNSNQRFKANETVKILSPPCQGESGIILEIVDDDPVSNFNAYKILCKKREMTVFCSHWEISKLRGGTQIEMKPLEEDVYQKLQEIMTPILEDERWLAFRYPVDFSEYPEYYAAVPYPMYLELIHKRLQHKYYRHVESFMWDVRQIAVDALIFNEPDSDIVKESEELVDIVHDLCRAERLLK